MGLLALLHTRLFLTFTFDCWRAGKDENGEGDTCQSTLENEGSSVAERKEEENWEESCLPSLTKTATEHKPSDTIRQEKPANHPQSTYSNTGKNCWLFYWRFVVCFNMLFMAVSSDKMTFFLFICKSIVTVKGKTDANSYLFERVNHSLSVCHPFECLKKIHSKRSTNRSNSLHIRLKYISIHLKYCNICSNGSDICLNDFNIRSNSFFIHSPTNYCLEK